MDATVATAPTQDQVNAAWALFGAGLSPIMGDLGADNDTSDPNAVPKFAAIAADADKIAAACRVLDGAPIAMLRIAAQVPDPPANPNANPV